MVELPLRDATTGAELLREELYAGRGCAGALLATRIDGDTRVAGPIGSMRVRPGLRLWRLRTSIPLSELLRPGATET